jgi:hypothetical protein
MKTLLNTKTENRVAQSEGMLKPPLSSELELALEITGRHKKPKGRKSSNVSESDTRLYDIFIYLDAQFKFKPSKDWLSSDLYKTIQISISGIVCEYDKNVAKLAATWKSQSFEDFLSIVGLF